MEKWYKKFEYVEPDEALYKEVREKIRALEKGPGIDVSIVMPAYNEEKRLFVTIYSLALQQTPLSVEIIVVNNNSTDRTQEILDKCGVRALFQPRPGIARTRQTGLEAARGRYHLCADADTLYPPTYVDGMVRLLQRPGVVGAYSPCSFLPDGRKSAFSLALYEPFRNLVLRMRFRNRPELVVGGASFSFYTEQALQIGWKVTIRRGSDGAMANELKKKGKIIMTSDPKVTIKTSSRRLDSDGSMLSMIWVRVKREMLRFREYFTEQEEYKDEDSNLIK